MSAQRPERRKKAPLRPNRHGDTPDGRGASGSLNDVRSGESATPSPTGGSNPRGRRTWGKRRGGSTAVNAGAVAIADAQAGSQRVKKPRPHVPTAFAYGVGAALLGALLTAVPAFVAWALDARSSSPSNDTFGVAMDIWALSHRGHVHTGDVTVVATPLLLTLFFGFLARWGALAAFPKERLASPDLQLILAGFVGGYVVGAQVIGLLAALGPAQVSWYSLLLGPVLVGGLAAASAHWKMRGFSPEVAQTHEHARSLAPLVMRRAMQPALRALRWWLLGGLIIVVLLAAWHGGRIVTITQQLDAGIGGNILLALGQLLFLGNASVYAASWASGADVHVGAATFGHGHMDAGTLPIVPIFGVLPDTITGAWTWVSLLLPIGVGIWLGVDAARSTARLSSLRIKVLVAAAAAALASVLGAALMWLSSMSVSTGLLPSAGPAVLAALLLALEFIVPAAISAACWHWWVNHRM